MDYMDLNQFTKTKRQLYDILAKQYYLPDFATKAITREYLIHYVEKDIRIFTTANKTTTRHHIRFRKFNNMELLDMLEEILKNQKLLKTGLTESTLPDKSWLVNAILSLDPVDSKGLLGPKRPHNMEFKLEINDAYTLLIKLYTIFSRFKTLIKDEPIAKGKGGLIKIPEDKKIQFKLQKVSRKIKKKEKALDMIDKSTKRVILGRQKLQKKHSDIKQEIEAMKAKMEVEETVINIDQFKFKIQKE
jgi:hypothetical protein